MNTYNIIFFIILIIIFIHHIVGNVAASFFTTNEIIDSNCTQVFISGKNVDKCDNFYNSSTVFLNYQIVKVNTKTIKTENTVTYDDNVKNPLSSILALTITSIVTLLFAIILLFIYVFYKNIYIKTFIYILLGLCLLFTCLTVILVPTIIMDKVKTSNCFTQLMYKYKYDRKDTCDNTLNYGYLANIITSFLVICILFYLYYYGFKTL